MIRCFSFIRTGWRLADPLSRKKTKKLLSLEENAAMKKLLLRVYSSLDDCRR